MPHYTKDRLEKLVVKRNDLNEITLKSICLKYNIQFGKLNNFFPYLAAIISNLVKLHYLCYG